MRRGVKAASSSFSSSSSRGRRTAGAPAAMHRGDGDAAAHHEKGDDDDERRRMSSLSDRERAALRGEWGQECRKVGLDHLADCFNKPDAVNPADAASLTPADADGDKDPNPVEAVTAGIAPTPCEPMKLAFLNGEGAGAVVGTRFRFSLMHRSFTCMYIRFRL